MIVLVTGTGTEVGKTWFAAATIEVLRGDGLTVSARKPVQSFPPGDTGSTDAEVLAARAARIPRRCARRTAGSRCRWRRRWRRWRSGSHRSPSPTSRRRCGRDRPAPSPIVTVVEGAGGARSPLADDGDTVALAHALAADRVVVVADAGLGTINAVRLTVAALSSWTPVVALNRYDDGDPLHHANRAWLADRDGFTVVTSPGQLAFNLTRELRRRAARPDRS